MEFLLQMDESARREWAASAPQTIAVLVHPFYEYLRRERYAVGPRIILATTQEGVDAYKEMYAKMPRVAMDRYPDQLLEVMRASSHAVIFEEYDRIMTLRAILPELQWENALIIPTQIGNPCPQEICVKADENPWYPQVADAFTHIGHKKDFVVYGGGFMALPEPACAGAVLLFLLGLQTHGVIGSAKPGTKAVLRV